VSKEKTFKPMLACSELPDFETLRYPLVASPKLDGIRCVVRDGLALTRSLKPVPNKKLRELLQRPELEGLDGELMAGETFQDVTSAVMSHDGETDGITFNVFDHHTDPALPFQERYRRALDIATIERLQERHFVRAVEHVLITSGEELATYEQHQLKKGYEGIMLRDPNGLYKWGRSTMREGALLKVKRFEDAEAIVVGFEPLYVNENEQKRDERGYAKRSSSKEGLVMTSRLGAFILQFPNEERPCTACKADKRTSSTSWCEECLGSGKLTFRCGSGTTDVQKDHFWRIQEDLLLATVKFKHQPHGAKDAPRSPVFLGFRDRSDM